MVKLKTSPSRKYSNQICFRSLTVTTLISVLFSRELLGVTFIHKIYRLKWGNLELRVLMLTLKLLY